MKLVSVFDIKAQSFSPPIAEHSIASAIRAFTTVVNEEKTPYNQFPDDFRLMELGEFDTGNGELKSGLKDLGLARDFLKQ